VKYLPEEGFDPIVVTSRPRGYPIRDGTLAREVPAGTVVLRAPTVPLHLVRWKLQGLLRRMRLSPQAAQFIGWPDEMAGWLPGLLVRSLSAVRAHRPHVLYTTSSPTTAHLGGLIVHRCTGLPWVADFRDPWTLNDHAGRQAPPYASASAALEREVTRRVSAAVIVDESVELLGLSHDDARLRIIRNGVDADDLGRSPGPVLRADRFRLAYVGSLYGPRDAAPVLAALSDLFRAGEVDPKRFELRLVGDTTIDRALDHAGLPISHVGYVDHPRAVQEMTDASALLFYAPAQTRGSSGKIYEYLASGRPVLCVASRENLAYGLVDELRAGPCVEPEDGAGIRRAVLELVADWERGALAVSPDVREEALHRFSRRRAATELASLLRAAIDQAAPRPDAEPRS
jgi:glycosyltransferase involved in cell wall biosynthesis